MLRRSTAVNVLSSLEGFVNSLTPLFDTFEARARMLSTIQCYQDEGKRIVSRRYPEGKSDCTLQGRKTFLIETYYVVLENLDSALRVRKVAYAELCEKFGFLKLLTDVGSEMFLAQQAEKLVKTYKKWFRASIFSQSNSVFKLSARFCMPGHECPGINATAARKNLFVCFQTFRLHYEYT